MAVWGGLTNSCEKKGREKQRIKGKTYPFECIVIGLQLHKCKCKFINANRLNFLKGKSLDGGMD